jgi:hypothetical protein
MNLQKTYELRVAEGSFAGKVRKMIEKRGEEFVSA